jgi:hypothetical protein
VRRLSLFLIVLFLFAAGASAQFLGQMSPASILKTSTGKAGAYFSAGDDAFAVVGSARYAFSDYTEGRFRLGLIDEDGSNTDPHLIVGLDGKYSLWKYGGSGGTGSTGTYNNPFDLALGFGFEFAQLEWSSDLGIGGSVIGSIPYHFKNNSAIEPYARLNLRYERVDFDAYDWDGHHHDSYSESNFEVGLNVGALFSVTPLVDFTAEFQFDNQLAFLFGIDFAAF